MSDIDDKALQLFRAAVPLAQIREKLRFDSLGEAEAAVQRGLAATTEARANVNQDELEIERIESLYRAAYPQALQGDIPAIKVCADLGTQKERLRRRLELKKRRNR